MEYIVQEKAAVVYDAHTLAPLLAIETPEWFTWLEEVTQFTFEGQHGAFSARKERVANGRGGFYWRAYRKLHGKLHRVYLGKSEQLTLARLTGAAQKLVRQFERQTGEPVEQGTKISPLPVLDVPATMYQSDEAAYSQLSAPHLLRTKLHIPVFHAQLVARDRLIQRFNVCVKQRLVVLSAAAGCGKTTLLSAWAQQACELVAWITLEQEDNDPVRFWSYVTAALGHTSPGMVASIMEALRSQPSLDLRPMLSDLLNMLDQEPGEMVLILDDYHVIDAQVIHDSLVFFLNHLPPQVHLVLASRYELPFSLAQLRVRRQVAEFHSSDLFFTFEEAELFLARTEGVLLTKSDVKALLERTEGWIAGLQLAALALHSQQDASAVISTFKGGHRFVLNYLLDDVLKHQPEQIRNFLLATSVLERFTASLCDVLTGEKSEALLAYLEQKNLFLTPLDDDRYWYRYHHLLAEALRTRLYQMQPERFYELHRKASLWYEQHHLLEEAVRHALAALESERAADLLQCFVETMLRHNEIASIVRWQELLPVHVLTKRPWLQLVWIRVYIVSGRLDRAEEMLHHLEGVESGEVDNDAIDVFRGRVAALSAHLYSTRGEAQEALKYASQALALLPGDDLEQQMGMRAAMGGAYLHAGRLIEAEQAFSEVITSSLHIRNPYRALETLYSLGQTQILLGRPEQANATYLWGLQLASRHNLTRSAVMGHIHAGRGNLLYEWNDLAGAQEHLVTGLELARRGENMVQALDCLLTLADVRQAQGRMQDAFALLRQAQELAAQTNDPFFLNFVTRRPVFLWLAANDRDNAARCARDTGLYSYSEVDDVTTLPSTFFLLIELLILVRLYIAQGNLSSAERLLLQLHSPLITGQNKRRRIQWLILHALTLDAEGELAASMEEMAQALALAEPLGYIRTFIDMGTALVPLLKILSHLKPVANYSHHYVQRLLVAANAWQPLEACMQSELLDDLLSERELLVLRYLAEGCSNREIAHRLVLTENTVKTHTRHIYEKLNVHSRTQAIARAREQNLL